jgi:hypothetical protein
MWGISFVSCDCVEAEQAEAEAGGTTRKKQQATYKTTTFL